MKIFPVKFLSPYDRAINLIKIAEDSSVSAVKNPQAKYDMEVKCDTKHLAKDDFLNSLIKKYKVKMSEITKNLKRKNG